MSESRFFVFDIAKSSILLMLSLIDAVYCIANPVCEGLELLFLLPLGYGISLFVFPRAHSYWKDNIGFIILFVSIWIKYLITPFLITLSQSTVNTLDPTVFSLRVSSLLAVFELYVTLFIVQHLWAKHKSRWNTETSYEVRRDDAEHATFKLYWTGVLFLLALFTLIAMRGHMSGVFSHLSTWFDQSADTSDFYTYDLVAFEVVKSGVVLIGISFFARRFYKTQSMGLRFIYFILALVIAIFNTYYFQYDQRTALTQLILATMFMFLSFFPSQRKLIIPVSVFFGVGLVIVVFLDGTMHYSIGQSVSNNFIAEISKLSELYVSGPTVVAKTLDTISSVRMHVSIETFCADIIRSMNFLSMIPFTRWITSSVNGIPTTNDLFKASIGNFNYILPNYTFACYYVSEVFGWLLEIIFIWATIKIICYIERKKAEHNDALYFYSFTYFETILGQAIFVNNFRLLWHSFTGLPFWLLIFAFFNNLGKNYKLKISR